MELKGIEDAYLNISKHIYTHNYANLAHIVDDQIQFPKRTTFLSDDEKNRLRDDKLFHIKDAIFITYINGVYSLICDIDKNANLITHELVLPDTIQGISHNYNCYNAEAAPIALVSELNIDFEKLINLNKPYHTYTINENDEVYAYVGEEKDRILDSFWDIDELYVVDGHHRLASTQYTKNKSHCLCAIMNIHSLKIQSITRVLETCLKPFDESIAYLIKEGHRVKAGSEPKEGHVLIEYKGDSVLVELLDRFSNYDTYLLHTQIISQAFGEYNSSNLHYEMSDYFGKADEVVFKTQPVSVDDFVTLAKENVILPPKTTCFMPKLPSLLVLSVRDIKSPF